MGPMRLAERSGVVADLALKVDLIRLDANRHLATSRRAELGQHLTPLPVARLMASMLGDPPAEVRLLDPGAGIGSLTAAAIESLTDRASPR